MNNTKLINYAGTKIKYIDIINKYIDNTLANVYV